jgi:hypothetical protein
MTTSIQGKKKLTTKTPRAEKAIFFCFSWCLGALVVILCF